MLDYYKYIEILKQFNLDTERRIKESNINYNSHYFIYNDDNNINIKYDLKCFDDSDFYKTSYISQDYICSLRRKIVLNNINKINKINQYTKLTNKLIKSLSFGINHIFHDEMWMRFDKDNFICKVNNDNINHIYCNSVNRSDLDKPELINFIKSLQNLQFGIKLINFDEDDEEDEDEDEDEEDDNDNNNNNKIVWIIICDLI
jgi:hypothetical protein